MNTLKWKMELETGNETIDSQVRLVIQIINECIAASKNNASMSELIVMMECVLHTLEEHFHDEEMIFLAHGALTKSHLGQHAYTLHSLKEKIEMLQAGECKTLTVQGVLFPLYDWIVDHLKACDFRTEQRKVA